jgi:hypothetical protein
MMKNIVIIGLITLCSTSLMAQEKVRKEIEVNEENGEKVMTVTTSENGKIEKDVYHGKETANDEVPQTVKPAEKQVMKMMKVTEENGLKVVTVKTMSEGNETEEVYKGAEAEKMIKEYKAAEKKESERRKVKVEKINE